MSIRFIGFSECETWCREYSVPSEVGDWRQVAKNPLALRFRIPEDAGARVALCRLLWKVTTSQFRKERLLWITDWSIWPSGEHLPIWFRVREALGTSRSLKDAPGCVCASADEDDGLSLLVLSCLFLWDAWLLTDTGIVVFLSHDEFGYVLEPLGEESPTASELNRLGWKL